MVADASTGTVNLYQRLLGDAWYALPDVLKRVHGTDAQLIASGEMDVTLGRFVGAGLVRWVLRMPRKEERVSVELRVRRNGEREHWDRRIGGWRFPTEQWAEEGLLIERYGSLDFPMTVTSDSESLTHWSDRMLLRVLGRGWPLPRWFSIHTWGTERRSASVPGAMDVSVRIETPSANCSSATTARCRCQQIEDVTRAPSSNDHCPSTLVA